MQKFLVVLLTLTVCITAHGQNFPQVDTRNYVSDSAIVLPRHPWRAVGEVIATNLVVGSFNRYIMNQDFAKINFKTIKRNFQIGPVWDTDMFSTNLVAHPYHGSLYFNAARSNGMNFWESVPFTLGGSFMWEFFMENEPPSTNDLIATTFGGTALGEITFRLSDLFLDDRTTGKERIGREILAGVISPVRAVNRIITGDAWKKSRNKGRVYTHVPINFVVSAGPRFLFEREHSDNSATSLHLAVRLDYGNPYGDDFYSPYEWFQLKAGFDFFSKQPLISQVNVIGPLWGKNVWTKGDRAVTVGVFQHFDYYDSQLKTSGGDLVCPYRISQAAALGGGVLYNKSSATDNVDVYAEMYVNGIALGASKTDHFFVDERDYNLGSGYSVKAFAGLTYRKHWSFLINTENYHIFTWKGYDYNLDLSTLTKEEYEVLNVQGDAGNARLTVFTTQVIYNSPKRWNLSLTNRYFSRRTHYKNPDFDDINTSTSDVMLTFGVRI